jgi:uncharacterized protein (TIGR02001 family)
MTSWGAFAAEGNPTPTFDLTGDVSLLSHYVEHGISQSDKSPALQGSFWFNFGPQFRMGLWGSNTNFAQGSDHFNLRANADIKIAFSPSSHMILAYSKSQYYNGGEHNGNISGVHLQFGEYRILYDNLSNWEATDSSLTRFAFGKVSMVLGGYRWNNEIGYNTPDLNNLNPYFDGRTGLGTKLGEIFFEGALTATSASSDLNGTGDVFVILSASTEL